MIFFEYLRNTSANNIRGRCTRWAQPTWVRRDPHARPGGLWSPRGPLTYLFIPHHHLPPEKKSSVLSLSRVLALKPANFDLFARSFVSKTVSGIVAWYVTPPFVQLVSGLVVYILNN